VSSIMEKFDSVDHGDKTLKEVRNLFDDKTSRATPKATPTPPNLKLFEATTKSAKFVDESYNMVNLKEKPENKRVQSAVTTCGLTSHAPDDSAFEVPHKSHKKQKQKKLKKSEVSRQTSKTDSNATEPITPLNGGEVQNKNDVEDMIQDLYSQDDIDAEDYDSPEMKQEPQKLNPVIEESHEYSVTPSRVVQSGAPASAIISPQRNYLAAQLAVREAQKNQKLQKSQTLESVPATGNQSRNHADDSITPKGFNQNEFFTTAMSANAPRRDTTNTSIENASNNSKLIYTEKKMQGA